MKCTETVKPGQGRGYIKTISTVLNPKDNGGESITLSVDVFDNGDGLDKGMFLLASLSTQSYGTSTAQISFYAFDGLEAAVKTIRGRLNTLQGKEQS